MYSYFLSFALLHYRFVPFSGGPRKCVGDQFALLEAIVALAILLQHMDCELVPDQDITMTTGATIHTTNVNLLYPPPTHTHTPTHTQRKDACVRCRHRVACCALYADGNLFSGGGVMHDLSTLRF